MSIVKLKKYIKENGKAKTAVALGLTETAAINNWLARGVIPVNKKLAVRDLKNWQVGLVNNCEISENK